MRSPDGRFWKCAVLAIVAAGLAVLPGGCGFRPLYGKYSTGESKGVIEDLAAIRVKPIRDRVGQQLYNHLLDRLNPRGLAGDSRYVLEVTLQENREELAFRKDETATRANLILTATYRLRELASNAIVFQSISRAGTSFNIVVSDFATLAAQNDARRRGLVLLGDEITMRLALFMNRRHSAKKG